MLCVGPLFLYPEQTPFRLPLKIAVLFPIQKELPPACIVISLNESSAKEMDIPNEECPAGPEQETLTPAPAVRTNGKNRSILSRCTEGVSMRPLPTPEEMSRWDHAAIERGIPEFTLMENASREALHVLLKLVGNVEKRRILLFMGGGNNGGDAACLARHLHDAGAETLVLHTRPLKAYKGTTGRHLRLARACGVSFAPASAWPEHFRSTPWHPAFTKTVSPGPDIVVDGLLGTGFSGSLRPKELSLVRTINGLASRALILSIDIPSGLSGLTGRPCPEAVRATATVTFEAAKPGLVLPEAAAFTGTLHIRPIGMPRIVREMLPPSFVLIGRELGKRIPSPSFDWHKGTAGSVLVLGGSEGLVGAPHLAARAALRSGAGLVSIAAPKALCRAIKADCPDIMTRSLGTGEKPYWTPALLEDLKPLLATCNAVVLGPGLGRSPETAAFVHAFLALERPRTIVDADALHALAVMPEALRCLRPDDMLTPHPGEAATLLGTTAAEIQTDRFAALSRLKELAPSVWLLKGAGTLAGTRGRPDAISPFAVPNLATGGSGDVLAGCLGALLAMLRNDPDTMSIACLGVLVHAEAGMQLAARFPARGNTASEIADALPEALGALREAC